MSFITDALRLENHPVAVFRAESMPEGAFTTQKGCGIPSLLMRCARLGDTCAADRAHVFCHGAVSGFGFGGMDDREHSSWAASDVPEGREDEMRHGGKRHFESPEIALKQLENIRDYGDGSDAIVFKDLVEAERDGDPVEVVVFVCDPTRISALALLAGYSRDSSDPAVISPYAHACQAVYAIPRAEGGTEHPHAVIGMTDMYARRYLRPDEMTFAVPYGMYRRMESDAPKSFLGTEKWAETLEKCLKSKQE